MQPMTTLRQWQIDQMQKSINTIRQLLRATTQEEASSQRDGGDGWTVLEVMGHLRDFELIFLERARLTLEQENPALPFPDPEQLVIENNCNADELQETLEAWIGGRVEHLSFLRSVGEEDWERPARHPTRGRFTLNDQLFLTVWHDMNHIEQMSHILLEAA